MERRKQSRNLCLWTLSGLVLAACGGGGGGGGSSGGLRLTTTGPTTPPPDGSLPGSGVTTDDPDDGTQPPAPKEHIVKFTRLPDSPETPEPPDTPEPPFIVQPLVVTPEPPPPTPINVVVTMGPVSDAQVWVDVDADGTVDAASGDILLGRTDRQGRVEIPAIHRNKNLIARSVEGETADFVPYGGLLSFTDEWRSLPSAGSEIVISPITDYLARRADTDKQAVLDSIFGNADDPLFRITLADILDAGNYQGNTGGHKAKAIKHFAYALYILAHREDIGNDGDPVDATVWEKIHGLFVAYREFGDSDLPPGSLENSIVALRDYHASPPVIMHQTGEAALLTGTEDNAVAIAELLPDLLRADAEGLAAAEAFFGFHDPLGQNDRPPGMAGIYLENAIDPISVSLAGGDAQKVIRVFITDDGGRIFPIASPDATDYLGTDPRSSTTMNQPTGFTFISWDNIHRLVFAADADAHGTFEIGYRVSDGEFYSSAMGTLRIEIDAVDDPARIDFDLPALRGASPDAYLDPDGDIMLAGGASGRIRVVDTETAHGGFSLAMGTAGDSASFTLDASDPSGVSLSLLESATAKQTGESYQVQLVASIDGEVAAEATYHIIQQAEGFTLPVEII